LGIDADAPAREIVFHDAGASAHRRASDDERLRMRVRLRRQYRFHVMPAADKKTRSRRDTRFSPF